MDYQLSDARFTMILVRVSGDLYKRHPFDLVRFNVDAEGGDPQIIPVGSSDKGKIFEKIWKCDVPPFQSKQRWEL
jgi:hypothetical protein